MSFIVVHADGPPPPDIPMKPVPLVIDTDAARALLLETLLQAP